MEEMFKKTNTQRDNRKHAQTHTQTHSKYITHSITTINKGCTGSCYNTKAIQADTCSCMHMQLLPICSNTVQYGIQCSIEYSAVLNIVQYIAVLNTVQYIA